MKKYLSICSISFLILFSISMNLFIFSLKFLLSDYCTFLEWEVISLNSSSIVMTILFDW